MKTRSDPRHIARVKSMQSLYTYAFDEKTKDSRVSPIISHLPRIDTYIAKSAPAFPLEKIARVDLAILRLAVYELLVAKKNPPKVIIDEAVELAKEFGNDTSGSFINGVLGTILESEGLDGRSKSH